MGLMSLEAAKPHIRKRLGDAAAQLFGIKAQVFRPEGHVVFHQRGDQLVVGVLEHHAAGFAHQVDVVVVCGVHPVNADGALVGDEQGV